MRRAALIFLALAVGCSPAKTSRAQGPQAPPASPPVAPPPGAPRLALPLDCAVGVTCELQNNVDRDPGPGSKDYRCGHQTYEAHTGVDIRLLDLGAQRAGVNVLAAAAGRVTRLRDGVADISIKTPGAPSVAGQECGNGVVIDHGQGWETQYCHLAKGSVSVKQGDVVASGQPIARVGLSGNTEYPHLHLTVRQGGKVVDPFAPGLAANACDANISASSGLWDGVTAKMLTYRRGVVLNAGFAAGPVSMDEVNAGGIATPGRTAQTMVAYVRAINLEAGDVQALVIIAPDGQVVAQSTMPALDRSKAQYIMYVGKRAPAQGWPRGNHVATYTITRGGAVALKRVFAVTL
ncbi:M23 family metallopeptidase [soil metagenome]